MANTDADMAATGACLRGSGLLCVACFLLIVFVLVFVQPSANNVDVTTLDVTVAAAVVDSYKEYMNPLIMNPKI